VRIDPFQEDVARIALAAADAHGFALAGGNALVAHGVLERKTEDIDLFSPEPGGPGAVAAAVCDALVAGNIAEVVRPPEAHQGEFARLEVTPGGRDDASRPGPGLAPVASGPARCRPGAPSRRRRQL
jgi:hypothetical protein